MGDGFDRTAVGAALERNAARPNRGAKSSIREQMRRNQCIQRMVDIEAKKAQGKGKGYERWVASFNLKQAAQALNLYVEMVNAKFAEKGLEYCIDHRSYERYQESPFIL